MAARLWLARALCAVVLAGAIAAPNRVEAQEPADAEPEQAGAQHRRDGDDAAATLRAADATLKRLLGASGGDAAMRRAAATRALGELFDIAGLTARALGPHWAGMSTSERRQLVDTLRTLIERTYLARLEGQLDYRIAYAAPRPEGADLWVPTRVSGGAADDAAEVAVDYRMHRQRGRWQVIDVQTEGASLVENYRAQFARIIAKEGTGGIMKRMRAKLAAGAAGP